MNTLLVIVLGLAGIVALIMIAAMFIKRDYSIRREIIIKRPLRDVFDYVRFLRNQEKFSKWVMLDPGMKKDFRGQDGTVGFVYAWDGNQQAGQGEQEITGIKDGERIDIQIRFVRPFKSIARTPITTERVTKDQTRVTWGMEGTSKYPLNLVNMVMAGVLAKDLQTSLETLKHNLEQPPQTNS